MKKVLNFIKKNIFGVIIGGIIFGSVGVYAATKLYASDVSVSAPTGSSLGSNATLQNTLDELYSIADKYDELKKEINVLKNKSAVTVLWTGNATTGNTITLSDSYKNYKILFIDGPSSSGIIRNDNNRWLYWGGLGTGINLTDTNQYVNIDFGFAKVNSNTSLTILNSGFVWHMFDVSNFINNKNIADKGITQTWDNMWLHSPTPVYTIYGIK